MANTMLLLNRRNEPMTPASLYKKCLEEAKQAGRSDVLTKGIKLSSLFLEESSFSPMMIPPCPSPIFSLSLYSAIAAGLLNNLGVNSHSKPNTEQNPEIIHKANNYYEEATATFRQLLEPGGLAVTLCLNKAKYITKMIVFHVTIYRRECRKTW